MKRHDKLFDEYIEELRGAKQLAEAWWNELLVEQLSVINDPIVAEKILRKRWPFGPASHPWVIAVFRVYYLRCEELNEEVEAEMVEETNIPLSNDDWGVEDDEYSQTTIPPRVFVIEQLANDETEDLYDFILNMMFAPIGKKGEKLC